jgi:hypothetical protein
LIALASLIWHGDVSKACEKVPALAQLKKWSVGDPHYEQDSCLQHTVVVFRDVCGWLEELLYHLELFERS